MWASRPPAPRYFLEYDYGGYWVCDSRRDPKKYVKRFATKAQAVKLRDRLNEEES
jgi:hypothetical protein